LWFQKNFYQKFVTTGLGLNTPFFSDHAPIWFQLDLLSEHKTCPFKFNCHWLEDKAFVEIVKKVWNDPRSITENSALRKLVWKLQVLKQCTKICLKEKTKKDKDRLVDLDPTSKTSPLNFWGNQTTKTSNLT
jgi:hypothetical protein